jgi:type II secretory ATPase GspE/PulE/Tfp pilus assembly ATPase PilB-like protein
MSQDARRDEELATQRRASILGLSYINTVTENKPLFKHLLTVQELNSYKVIPIYAGDHQITFGVTNTTSQQTMRALKQRFLDQRISFGLISDSGFRAYMQLYDPPQSVEYQDITLNRAGNRDLIQTVSDTLERVKADDMLGYLVQQAHRLNASDIHLETGEKAVRIRLRIDGVLQPIAVLSKEKYRTLISAVASAGNISTAADYAQQGHIAREIQLADGSSVHINVRLETVQTIHGMDIVMRLFNMNQDMYNLDRLGLSASERSVVDGVITKPSGLVLAVGPTGSGKTTTLYSILNSLNSEQRKIITIEDPVEYQLQGITQISVATKSSKDIDFAESLRAVLRLDPDIVMVGEIRDLDTARTALQAALTGHLVLSTFHASSAAAALTRMADVIGKNPLFVSAIRFVMAQRLVRRLDDATKVGYQPDATTVARIKQALDTLPAGTDRPSLDNLTLYKPGSSDENPYGYRGQIPLREQFTMTGHVKEILERDASRVTTQQLEAAAVSSGMRTMLQDGMLKVIQGETTLEEIYRVVG